VAIKLIKGPFSNLEGTWDFTPVGDAAQRACKTELRLKYGFDNPVLAGMVGPVFDKIAATMVDAFVKRADQVYG
jgi:ribosome-associated toxin RatA of RatAB toxin-antitoxin module